MELKLTTQEAYGHLQKILEQVRQAIFQGNMGHIGNMKESCASQN